MHIAPRRELIHTHRHREICNNYCFPFPPTVTMVSRMHLSVTLYVSCLSCFDKRYSRLVVPDEAQVTGNFGVPSFKIITVYRSSSHHSLSHSVRLALFGLRFYAFPRSLKTVSFCSRTDRFRFQSDRPSAGKRETCFCYHIRTLREGGLQVILLTFSSPFCPVAARPISGKKFVQDVRGENKIVGRAVGIKRRLLSYGSKCGSQDGIRRMQHAQ